MKSKGIRIFDIDPYIGICVKPIKILEEIQDIERLNWAILYFDGINCLDKKISVPNLEKQINDSEDGFRISWDQLNHLGDVFEQIIDIVIIGSINEKDLRRYEDDQEMYETCDMVIVMFDGCYWEVFSKEDGFMKRLLSKFKKTEPLETDFLKHQDHQD